MYAYSHFATRPGCQDMPSSDSFRPLDGLLGGCASLFSLTHGTALSLELVTRRLNETNEYLRRLREQQLRLGQPPTTLDRLFGGRSVAQVVRHAKLTDYDGTEVLHAMCCCLEAIELGNFGLVFFLVDRVSLLFVFSRAQVGLIF